MKKTFIAVMTALITTAFCFVPSASARSLSVDAAASETTEITFSVAPGETVEVLPALNYEVHNLCGAKAASYELSTSSNSAQTESVALKAGESDFFNDDRFDTFVNTSSSCVEELVESH